MRSLFLGIAAAVVLIAPTASARAAEDLVETVKNGCKTELESYCAKVTPGEGRVLACLYAHDDQLSGRCEYTLYDASVQLERVVAALAYVENECHADIESYCAKVKEGEGRIATCLKANNSKISKRCAQAMTDVGVK
jgi:hypothetical protein